MEILQPAIKNGRNVWDQINMPLQEFQERVRMLRTRMKARGMDVLLAYGLAFNEYGNPCYLTHYQIRLPRGTLVVVPKEGDPALFFEGAARGLPSARMITWVQDIRPCPDVARACGQYLKEKGFASGAIGLAGLDQWMPRYQLKFLLEVLPGARFLPGDDILQEMRLVKSSRETDQIRRASRIIRRCFEFMKSASFDVMNERVVEALIYREARMEGAEDVRVLFGRPGKIPWAMRPPENSALEPVSLFIVYLAVAYERYWAEGIRTFRAEQKGFSTPDLAGLEALYGRATACLQPGKAIFQCTRDLKAEIQKAGAEVIDDYGFGQGIGLSLKERPFFKEDAEGALGEGMCFTLRLCVKDAERDGAMVGNTFCVSGGRVESLTS